MMTFRVLRVLEFAVGLVAVAQFSLCVILPIWVTVGLAPRAIVVTLASAGLWALLRRLARKARGL